MSWRHALRQIWNYRSTLIVLLTPLLLLPMLVAIPGQAAKCAFCILLMSIYWVTEAVSIAVTSLLPLVLFPTLGVMSSEEACNSYFKDVSLLYVGGVIIAIAIEKTNLHRRISLRILTLVGAKPRRLMFGFMLTTYLMSMWMTNTTTTTMVLPIVEVVSDKLIACYDQDEEGGDAAEEMTELKVAESSDDPMRPPTGCMDGENGLRTDNGCKLPDEINSNILVKVEPLKYVALDEEWKLNLKKALIICVPYAATIGGTATLTGTPTNIVLAGMLPQLFPNITTPIEFGNWFVYSFPQSMLYFLIAFLWISSFYLGFNFQETFCCWKRTEKTEGEISAENMLQREYQRLGRMSWAEISTLIVFVTTASLWFLRNPGGITGWSSLFEKHFVRDGTVAMAAATLLFLLPSRKPEFLRRGKGLQQRKPVQSILTWKETEKILPWSVMFLLGAGFAIAAGSTKTGLSVWLGNQLTVLEGTSDWLLSLIVTTFACFFTEVSSNMAIVTLFIPIFAQLAQSLMINPLYFLIPLAHACSMAFMLPVATPPNAIAFSYGHLKVLDTVKCGFALNIIGIVIVILFLNTYGIKHFDLASFPDWAAPINVTVT